MEPFTIQYSGIWKIDSGICLEIVHYARGALAYVSLLDQHKSADLRPPSSIAQYMADDRTYRVGLRY
jgi:hypothetical protein